MIFTSNALSVRFFAETEFWFSFIKVAAILGMIALGAWLICQDSRPFPQNFSNLWAYGGILPKGIWGFCLAMVTVIFSFGGVELIGITAGEAENPERSLPKAMNQIIWRILVSYAHSEYPSMTAIKRILSIDDQASICQMIQFTMSDMSDDNVHYEVDVAADGASGLDKAKAQRYDLIISNPPYLTQGDMEQLQPEVRHDPALALYGGDDGLDFYRRIAADSPAYVKVGGYCAVEIGAGQTDDVTAIFCRHGAYDHEQTVKDYGGIDRVLVFSRKE